MSGGEHFVIPHHHYHYYHRILSAAAQKGEIIMNFWSEIVKEVGTVLVEVLVRIAEEMENNN